MQSTETISVINQDVFKCKKSYSKQECYAECLNAYPKTYDSRLPLFSSQDCFFVLVILINGYNWWGGFVAWGVVCKHFIFFSILKLKEKSLCHPWTTRHDLNQTSETSHTVLYFIAKYNRTWDSAQHIQMLAQWKRSLQLVDISIYFLVMD